MRLSRASIAGTFLAAWLLVTSEGASGNLVEKTNPPQNQVESPLLYNEHMAILRQFKHLIEPNGDEFEVTHINGANIGNIMKGKSPPAPIPSEKPSEPGKPRESPLSADILPPDIRKQLGDDFEIIPLSEIKSLLSGHERQKPAEPQMSKVQPRAEAVSTLHRRKPVVTAEANVVDMPPSILQPSSNTRALQGQQTMVTAKSNPAKESQTHLFSSNPSLSQLGKDFEIIPMSQLSTILHKERSLQTAAPVSKEIEPASGNQDEFTYRTILLTNLDQMLPKSQGRKRAPITTYLRQDSTEVVSNDDNDVSSQALPDPMGGYVSATPNSYMYYFNKMPAQTTERPKSRQKDPAHLDQQQHIPTVFVNGIPSARNGNGNSGLNSARPQSMTFANMVMPTITTTMRPRQRLENNRQADTENTRHADAENTRYAYNENIRHGDTENNRYAYNENIRHDDTENNRYTHNENGRHANAENIRHTHNDNIQHAGTENTRHTHNDIIRHTHNENIRHVQNKNTRHSDDDNMSDFPPFGEKIREGPNSRTRIRQSMAPKLQPSLKAELRANLVFMAQPEDSSEEDVAQPRPEYRVKPTIENPVSTPTVEDDHALLRMTAFTAQPTLRPVRPSGSFMSNPATAAENQVYGNYDFPPRRVRPPVSFIVTPAPAAENEIYGKDAFPPRPAHPSDSFNITAAPPAENDINGNYALPLRLSHPSGPFSTTPAPATEDIIYGNYGFTPYLDMVRKQQQRKQPRLHFSSGHAPQVEYGNWTPMTKVPDQTTTTAAPTTRASNFEMVPTTYRGRFNYTAMMRSTTTSPSTPVLHDEMDDANRLQTPDPNSEEHPGAGIANTYSYADAETESPVMRTKYRRARKRPQNQEEQTNDPAKQAFPTESWKPVDTSENEITVGPAVIVKETTKPKKRYRVKRRRFPKIRKEILVKFPNQSLLDQIPPVPVAYSVTSSVSVHRPTPETSVRIKRIVRRKNAEPRVGGIRGPRRVKRLRRPRRRHPGRTKSLLRRITEWPAKRLKSLMKNLSTASRRMRSSIGSNMETVHRAVEKIRTRLGRVTIKT